MRFITIQKLKITQKLEEINYVRNKRIAVIFVLNYPPHSENIDKLLNDTSTSNLKSSFSQQKGKKPPTYKNTIKLR